MPKAKNKEAAVGSQNRTVTPNEAKSALTHCIKLQRPIMMWGAPGIGKSDIVKQIADALEISADSVRYYTRIGFLVPSKSHNGYKYYRSADVTRLRFILSARSLGFSVVFAGQDLPAFQKASKEEAASIGANTNIKVCMKLEDPTETWDFFMKSAGESYVSQVENFQVDFTFLNIVIRATTKPPIKPGHTNCVRSLV